MKCYFASPSSSHIISKEAAVRDAMRALTRFPGWLRPVLHVNEIRDRDNVVWSPLIQGQFILRDRGPVVFNETAALAWCLWNLEHMPFDTLVLSNTIPRAKGCGSNGMDAEEALARKLGYRIMRETDLPQLAPTSDSPPQTTPSPPPSRSASSREID